MRKILVINGPNINLLGIREPDVYGREDYNCLIKKIMVHSEKCGIEVKIFQSNHEGCIVDEIQSAYKAFDGIVINPGGYTHTSIAILDALLAVGIPTVEVHISDIDQREAFRKVSFIRKACISSVIGHGISGYCEAIDILLDHIK